MPAGEVDPPPEPVADRGAPLSDPVRAVRDALRDAGAQGRVVQLPTTVRTPETAAAALGCAPGAVARSDVHEVDGALVLVLVSGAHHVDATQLAGVLDVPEVLPGRPDDVRRRTGQPPEAVSPVGGAAPLRTVVDVDLAPHDEIWVPAGALGAYFATSYDELLRISAGTAAEVS